MNTIMTTQNDKKSNDEFNTTNKKDSNKKRA